MKPLIAKVDKELSDLTIDFFDSKNKDEETLVSKYSALVNPLLAELKCEDRFFFKLITRSPKDFLADKYGKPVALCSVSEMVAAMLSSMRCFEDIINLAFIDKFALVIRPYIDFERGDEWRCFIKGKSIVGISQYYYDTNFNYSTDFLKQAEAGLLKFISETVIPNVPLDDFVADVVYYKGRPYLLEMNPYWLSDPCLFLDYDSMNGKILVKV